MAALDLMAYTRGQQEAQRDNWTDVLTGLRADAMGEALQQSQTNFDLNLPVRQTQVDDFMNISAGNKRAGDWLTNLAIKSADIPADMRGAWTADQFRNLTATFDPTQPGAKTQWAAILDAGRRQAFDFAKANDMPAALAILDTLPGASAAVGTQAGQTVAWNNPTDAMFTAAGATAIEGDTANVMFNGVKIPKMAFANLMQSRTDNPLGNAFSNRVAQFENIGLQQAQQQALIAQQQARQQQSLAALQSTGGQGFIGPNGQLVVTQYPMQHANGTTGDPWTDMANANNAALQQSLGQPSYQPTPNFAVDAQGNPMPAVQGNPASYGEAPAVAAPGTPAGVPVASQFSIDPSYASAQPMQWWENIPSLAGDPRLRAMMALTRGAAPPAAIAPAPTAPAQTPRVWNPALPVQTQAPYAAGSPDYAALARAQTLARQYATPAAGRYPYAQPADPLSQWVGGQ